MQKYYVEVEETRSGWMVVEVDESELPRQARELKCDRINNFLAFEARAKAQKMLCNGTAKVHWTSKNDDPVHAVYVSVE